VGAAAAVKQEDVCWKVLRSMTDKEVEEVGAGVSRK